MEHKVKRIITLSNSTKSTGQGIPERVSTSHINREVFDSFLSRDKDQAEHSARQSQRASLDIYSTIIG